MSGLVPVLPLKATPTIAGPGAVPHAEPVSNDIRMPSRAGLQQQLDVGLFAGAGRGPAYPPASAAAAAGEAVTLSPTARALSVILDLPARPASKITGAQALWPLRQPPMAPLLAATLAHTVDNSGLFYESHLQQFAEGARTLAQLMQEPQARLPVMLSAGVAVAAPGLVDALALPEGMAKDLLGSTPGNTAGNALESSPADSPENQAALQVQGQDLDVQEQTLKTLGASAQDAARSSALVPAGVHADAVALVRQQLDMLAQPVFRWGGEAWPDTPMDWEIQQEPDDRVVADGGEAPERSWSTRLALHLPELKDVEVRLSLVGDTLQLQLSASEKGTLALLGNERHELPARFAALGLQLKGVWVGALAKEEPKEAPKDGATRNG
jgi:hypothetical protein